MRNGDRISVQLTVAKTRMRLGLRLFFFTLIVVLTGCEKKPEVITDRRDDVAYRETMSKLAEEQRTLSAQLVDVNRKLAGMKAVDEESAKRIDALKAEAGRLEKAVKSAREVAKRQAYARREKEAADRELVKQGKAVERQPEDLRKEQ